MVWNNRKFSATSLAVPALAYLFVFWSGWLRGFEYKLYDLSLRLRPPQSIDSRIVIIGVTEKDLQKLGQDNIDDATLVKVIKEIKTHNPRVIGLDLHRNVRVGCASDACKLDRQELSALFRTTPNLIGIEKTTGGNIWNEAILPHPELATAGRTGASELIEDSDRIIRRAYLEVQKSAKETHSSFGLAVALKYLEQESIQPMGYKTWLRLNNAIFPAIDSIETDSSSFFQLFKTKLKELKEESHKFYSSEAIDGYQILLNYRVNRNLFEQISIFELLEKGYFRKNLQNKIVLIGRVDELSKDFYEVPHIRHVKTKRDYSFGVIIHAQLVSYLIDAALEGRTTLKLLPNFVGNSLIILLLLEPLLLLNWLDKKKRKAFNLLVLAGCQILFILAGGWLSLYYWGYWIPVALLGVTTSVITATLGFLIYHYRHEQEKQNLAEIVQQKSQELEIAYKKILAQEKIFTYQGLAQILSHELKNKTNVIYSSAQNDNRNWTLLQELIEQNFWLFEDLETNDENCTTPLQLCELGLENTSSILRSVQKITLILQELDRDSGRDSLEVGSVNINETLSRIIAELTQIKSINYLQIKANYDDSLPELVGVEQHLERALENIITNAFDSLSSRSKELMMYTPILEVSTFNRNEFIEIKIRDNGKGIPLVSLKEIFKIHYTTKVETGNKGLGLFFAQEFIHEHGGDIKVESQFGEYAEFAIRLPKN